MATSKARPRATPAGRVLPPITVMKLDQAMYLAERMVYEHTATFIEHGQHYKDQHREGSRRPLTGVEIAQIAAGMNAALDTEQRLTLDDAKQQIDTAGITVYDEPGAGEVLMAAGIATGTAFLSAVQRLTALIEMSDDDLETACEADRLDAALDEIVKAWRRTPLTEMRARATAAFEHFSKAAGFGSGKALALAGKTVWQGLQTAMGHLDGSQSPPSTGSPASTAGDAERSSTASPGAMS